MANHTAHGPSPHHENNLTLAVHLVPHHLRNLPPHPLRPPHPMGWRAVRKKRRPPRSLPQPHPRPFPKSPRPPPRRRISSSPSSSRWPPAPPSSQQASGAGLPPPLLWFGWTALFHRNNLIANPSIPYTGLLLILSILVPTGEPLAREKRNATLGHAPLGLRAAPGSSSPPATPSPATPSSTPPAGSMAPPCGIFWKIPSHAPASLRDLMASLPDPLLAAMTWGTLAAELLFLPLALWGKSRPVDLAHTRPHAPRHRRRHRLRQTSASACS